MIVAVNKGGEEFASSCHKSLDQKSIFLRWSENSMGCSAFDKANTFTFYNDISPQNIDLATELGELCIQDREIFNEIADNPEFLRQLEKYLARRKAFESFLSAYFSRYYQTPHYMLLADDFLDIHVIADLNFHDDFVIVNGLLCMLHTVLPSFIPPAKIRLFILSPEVETDFISDVNQLHLLYSNLTFFYLVRQNIEYRMYIMLCHGSNETAWKFVCHFIESHLSELVEKKEQQTSVFIPFFVSLPETSEKEAFLRHIHDVQLAELLFSSSERGKESQQELALRYNRHIEYGVGKLLKEFVGNVMDNFKDAIDFTEFISILSKIVSVKLELETDFISSVKEDYIIGLLDMNAIEKLKKEVKCAYSDMTANAVEKDYKRIKDRFYALKKFSWIKHFFFCFTRRFLIPDKEIKSLLRFHYRAAALKKYQRELSFFILKISNLRKKGKDALLKKALFDHDATDRLSSHVRKQFLLPLDISQLKKDFCRNSGNRFYIGQKAKKGIFDWMDRIMLNNGLDRDFLPGKTMFSFWKANCFPWDTNFACQLFVFAAPHLITDKSSLFFNITSQLKTLRKKDFTNEYYYRNFQEKLLTVTPEKTFANDDGSVIYLQTGFFPLESILLKEYKDVLKKKVFESRMLDSLIKQSGHLEAVEPFQQRLNLASDDNNGKVKLMIELKRKIMDMTLPSLKEEMEGQLKKMESNRHTLVSFINSLNRIESLINIRDLMNKMFTQSAEIDIICGWD